MSSQSYPSLFGAWAEASTRMFSQMMEANRAAMSAFSFGPRDDDGASTGNGRVESDVEPAGDLPDWEFERSTEDYESFGVGDYATFTKTITDADIRRFATASGDTNPVHLDEAWAEQTRFEGRIAHGILVTGLVSAALARLPGGIIYLSQDTEFQAPVRIGDRLTATVEVVEDLGGGRYRLRTTVDQATDDDRVIDGEAVILVVDTSDIETDD